MEKIDDMLDAICSFRCVLHPASHRRRRCRRLLFLLPFLLPLPSASNFDLIGIKDVPLHSPRALTPFKIIDQHKNKISEEKASADPCTFTCAD